MAQKIASVMLLIGVSFEPSGVIWDETRIRYAGLDGHALAHSLGHRVQTPTAVYALRNGPAGKDHLYTYSGEAATWIAGAGTLIPPKTARLPVPADTTVEAFVCKPSDKPGINGDLWEVREEFLALRKSNSKLLKFLRKWKAPIGIGRYLVPVSDPTENVLDDVGRLIKGRTMVVFPEEIWDLQTLYRNALTSAPEEWLSVQAPLGTPHHQATFPHYVAKAHDIKSAIEMTITIDKLNDVRHDKCAREDCYTPFVVRPGKSFCSHYCGHLVNLRERREADRKAKAKKTGPRRKSRT